MVRGLLLSVVLMACLWIVNPGGLPLAHATTGCEMIGVGGRSLGMGGVDIGIATDTSAMVTNPAGITQIKGTRVDFGHGLFYPWVRFKNEYNSFSSSCNGYGHDPFLSYLLEWGWVKHLPDKPVSFGIGLFTVGGGGFRARLKNKYFSHPQLALSGIAFNKFTPTIAYQLTPKLSMGFSLNIYYCPLELKMLNGPYYIETKRASAWGRGCSLGLLYQATDKLKMGITYTSESMLDDYKAENGYMTMAGGIKQRYTHTRIKGLRLPQKVGVGISYQFTPKLLAGFDVEWQQYSQTLHKIEIKMQGLSIPPCYLRWNNSTMVAIGAEYKVTPRFALRTGYSYTNHISSEGGIFPYAAIAGDSHNVTVGFGYSWKNFLIDFGWDHHFDTEGKVRKSHAGEEFGNSTSGYGSHTIITTFTWLFD